MAIKTVHGVCLSHDAGFSDRPNSGTKLPCLQRTSHKNEKPWTPLGTLALILSNQRRQKLALSLPVFNPGISGDHYPQQLLDEIAA
jgi:hypothetical protein